jgi:hypothetical protein
MIALSRTGGLRRPVFRELLQIDDGQFTLWRSVGKATSPPSAIGRFAGTLAPGDRDGLAEAAERAAASGAQKRTITPDSPVDTFDVDGVQATLGFYDRGEGAWEALADRVRPLLHQLTELPVAAVDLSIEEDGASLEHHGSGVLRLELSSLMVTADLWTSGQQEGSWSSGPVELGKVGADSGWRQTLPFDHPFALEPGKRLSVQVTFGAYDGDKLVPVSLLSTKQL